MNDSTYTDWQAAGIDLRGKHYGQVKVACPRCNEEKYRGHSDTPLSVNITEAIWLCHRCGWAGRLRGHWSDAPAPRREFKKPEVVPSRQIVGKAREFLTSRGIDPDLAEEVGVYSDPKGTSLAFPYHKHGELVHVKYRSVLDKKFWSTKDTELTLYGYDDCVGSDTVLVCEGEMDRLAFLMAGFIPTASVPNGAPSPGQKAGAKLDFLDATEEVFGPAKKVIIATDADEPGRTLADELVRRIGPEKCYRVKWPEDCKDANDVLLRHGAAALAGIVDRARPEPVEGILTGLDIEDRITQLYDEGQDSGLRVGFPHLDRIYRVKEGLMTIVTGHSSHGKSTALDQVLLKLAEKHGWHIAIFSPEQQPLENHQIQLMQQYTGSPFYDGPTQRMTPAERDEANAWISRHFTYILPDNPSLDTILEKAKAVIFRTGAKGVVIDPWNELEHTRSPYLSETDYISATLQKLRAFARLYGIHLWLVAHPTKMPHTDDGEEQVPLLQNISGSINFRNKADFGLTVFRHLHNPDNPVDIIVTKSRWKQYAELGSVRFQYNPVNQRLIELGPTPT